MNLLHVQNLNITFRQGRTETQAVRGVSLAITRGQTVALVGESGSGKSVTALALMRLLPLSAQVSGRIHFNDIDVTTADEAALQQLRGDRIAMVFQEPMTSLNPLHSIARQVGEVLTLHKNMDAQQARARTLELLQQVGLPNPETRMDAYPHELSGGQRQRVMIAMALANDPDLLIADEPTTALDVTVQAQILKLLKDLQRERGMALLLISHDLGIVRKMADHICVMQHGAIVEQAPAAQLTTAPQHPYTRQLLAAEPKGSASAVPPTAPIVLSAKDVKVHFPIKTGLLRRATGWVRAVDGVSLTLRAGETMGIVGESGSGKTTLGMALLRLQKSTGQIRFAGRDIATISPRDLRVIRRDMQIVFQDPFGSLSPRMTAGDIVAEGLDIHGIGSAASRAEAAGAMLAEVGLDPAMAARYPHEFSGGQRQRIAIARAMIMRPKLVVLDEPTSALDMSVQAQIVELLRNLQAKYQLAYLFISHDLRVVRALANHVIVMKDGRVVEQGDSARIFAAPQQDYTKQLLAAALNLEPV